MSIWLYGLWVGGRMYYGLYVDSDVKVVLILYIKYEASRGAG